LNTSFQTLPVRMISLLKSLLYSCSSGLDIGPLERGHEQLFNA
jgi:hypothetical protein